jgi:RNA polymerase sigma factor (sigma-70 family)
VGVRALKRSDAAATDDPVRDDTGADARSSGRYVRLTDGALVRASRVDADAFDELYRRLAPRIWRYLRRRTRDDDVATELTAETFARAWIARSRFSPGVADALPWMFGIARLVILESVRRQQLELRATESLGLGLLLDRGRTEARPDEAWLDDLDDALDTLPPDQRSALSLRYRDDLPYDEIGRRLGISVVGARARVFRGLATLRRYMQAL